MPSKNTSSSIIPEYPSVAEEVEKVVPAPEVEKVEEKPPNAVPVETSVEVPIETPIEVPKPETKSKSILPSESVSNPEVVETKTKVEPTPTPPKEKSYEPELEIVPLTKDEEIPLEKKNAFLYKMGIGLFLVILLGTTGVLYMRTKLSTVSEVEIEATPIPTSIPKATAEPVAEINLDRDEITLEILNGTSTSGLAGKQAKIFEDLGYEVEEVGNADDSDKNKLYVKTGFEDQIGKLLQDVEDELDITKITDEIDDLDTTARIILGG